MGIFTNLMSKIFGHGQAVAATTSAAGPEPVTNGLTGTAVAEPVEMVDVTAILDDLATKSPESLDWKASIVDLLKLVGMESSLSSRRALATELNYPGDQNDSAAMNVWLHKEVIKKLAENGGKVPQDLLD